VIWLLVIGITILAWIPSAEQREDAARLRKLIERIDEGVEASDERIQKEVAAYVEGCMEDVARQIATDGKATVPTFAGDYILTEKHLQEAAHGWNTENARMQELAKRRREGDVMENDNVDTGAAVLSEPANQQMAVDAMGRYLYLSQAFRIAVEVHGAQRDKGGEPYLFHVMRVAMAMDDDFERATALLHDAIEDTPGPFINYTGFTQTEKFKLLHRIEVLYGEAVSQAVFALTRQDWGVDEKGNWCPKEEPYLDYIRRLSSNPLAVKVKFADIQDNRNPARLKKLPRAECDRLYDKYEQAWLTLYAAADEAGTLPEAGGWVRPTETRCP